MNNLIGEIMSECSELDEEQFKNLIELLELVLKG